MLRQKEVALSLGRGRGGGRRRCRQVPKFEPGTDLGAGGGHVWKFDYSVYFQKPYSKYRVKKNLRGWSFCQLDIL